MLMVACRQAVEFVDEPQQRDSMCGKLIDDKVLVWGLWVCDPSVEEVHHHRYLLAQPNWRAFAYK